jgi:ketosteroid isomerase-like protein
MMVLVLAAALIVACGDDGEEVSRPPVSAAEVQALDGEFEAAATAQIDAWNSHDADAIRAVYTEDVEHHDGQVELVGLDSVTRMAEGMFERNPDWDGRLAGLYIGGDDALGVWEAFGLRAGGDDYTEDRPLIEYDVLEVRDGQIASWTLYYHPETIPAFTQLPGQPEAEAALLADYATTWSSDDPEAVAGLYATEGTRTDPVFGQLAEGQDDMEGYATEWFEWYPDVSVELVQPIAEASHEEPELGGIFSIRPDGDDDSCEVLMAVLLETDEDQQIVAERVYYDADSLIACGWAA